MQPAQIDFDKECICYHCVKRYSDLPESERDCICDGACDSAPDEYIKDRCELCDVKTFCDIYQHPELYKE